MTKKPVLAIGLDSADPVLLEEWMDKGYLKNLQRLRSQGLYTRLNNRVKYETATDVPYSCTEAVWVMAMTGCLPDKTGYWDTVEFDPKTYGVRLDTVNGGYDFQEYPPFYALAEKAKSVIFDIPVVCVNDAVDGIQITGWGGHYPFQPSESKPPSVLDNILRQYGKNPLLFEDNGRWWEKKYAAWVLKALDESLEKRVQIFKDLMAKGSWDLFLTAFGETHTVGHDLVHYSMKDHPLYSEFGAKSTNTDLALEGFQKIDAAVGELIDLAPADTNILVFSLHGMGVNYTDLPNFVFLPELMYRLSFPGKCGLTSSPTNQPPEKLITKNVRNSWHGEIWRQVHEKNPIKKFWHTWTHKFFLRGDKNGLNSPYGLMEAGIDGAYLPNMYYSGQWSKMKAFALPAFADGHIRINLKGREKDGIVSPSDYHQVCDEVEAILHDLKDARTGQRLVSKIVRSRKDPMDMNPKLPEGDLIVVWNYVSTDVVDSEKLGRIGPVTYNRPGGHRECGFLMATGPDFSDQSKFDSAESVDLAPTILDLMGVESPTYFDGKSLLDTVPVQVS